VTGKYQKLNDSACIQWLQEYDSHNGDDDVVVFVSVCYCAFLPFDAMLAWYML